MQGIASYLELEELETVTTSEEDRAPVRAVLELCECKQRYYQCQVEVCLPLNRA